MKTGIILEIKGKTAIVMKNDGEFVEAKAKEQWRKGDVITLQSKARNFKALYTVAACLAIILLTAFGGHRLYFTETTLISMDINPSLELSINRFGRVISVTSYNEEAADVLKLETVKGLPYAQAIDALIQSDTLHPYLENNGYLDFAVYSESDDTELVDYLNSRALSATDIYPDIQVNCRSTDKSTVTDAHSHQMSIGKYLAFLELQELAPELEADDYSHSGINEIRNQIRHHHQDGNDDTSDNDNGSGDNGNSGNNNSDDNNGNNNGNNGHNGSGRGNHHSEE